MRTKVSNLIAILENYPDYEFRGFGIRNNEQFTFCLQRDSESLTIDIDIVDEAVEKTSLNPYDVFYRLRREDAEDAFIRLFKKLPTIDNDHFRRYAFEELKKRFFIHDYDIMIKDHLDIIADEYFTKYSEIMVMSASHIRTRKFSDCRLCESEENCDSTSIKDCRQKMLENIK